MRAGRGRARARRPRLESSALSTRYRDLLHVPGIPALVGSMLLARVGGQMVGVVAILFILERYHSPALAGLFTVASLVPGTLLSPLAGALLDRYGRIHLIIVDYVVGALTGIAVAVPAALNMLPPWLLLTIGALSSLTLPLAISGSRSLMPLSLPRHLWDRGNAVDAATWEVTSIFGPALAGVAVAVIGPLASLVAVGATWMVAGLCLLRVPEPPVRGATEHHVLREAWDGLVYVFARNRTLRNLSIVVPVTNLGGGILLIAAPVLVLTRMHDGPAAVGLLWSAMGAGSVVGNLIGGRVETTGREGRYIAIGYGASATGLVILALAPAFWMAALGMVVSGVFTGFGDISMFGLRQRATDPAWFGRTMSISMMVNAGGRPIGSGFGGPLVARSVTAALLLAAATVTASGALAALLLRRLPSPEVGAADGAREAGDAVPIVNLDGHLLETGLGE